MYAMSDICTTSTKLKQSRGGSWEKIIKRLQIDCDRT